MGDCKPVGGLVNKHGDIRASDLYAGTGPFKSRSETLAAEKALGDDLKARGFRVFDGQGEPFGGRMLERLEQNLDQDSRYSASNP